MHIYRCYFLNQQNHMQAYENIEADALDEAVDRALATLRQHPEHRGIEIWDGPKRVYCVPVTA